MSNKSNKRLMRYCTFIFSISCSIPSVTSYFIEKEAKNLQNGDSILLKFLTLKWNISRTIWRIEVGDGSLFCIFHALSFELNFFFDRRFPLMRGYQLTFLYVGVFGVPAHFLIYGKDTRFLFVIGCSR